MAIQSRSTYLAIKFLNCFSLGLSQVVRRLSVAYPYAVWFVQKIMFAKMAHIVQDFHKSPGDTYMAWSNLNGI